MKEDKIIIKKIAFMKLYGQGVNASPLPMTMAALSAINVHKKIGISYRGFLFDCKKDYIVMNYIEEDLIKIGKVMWKKRDKNFNYFKKLRQVHKKEQNVSFELYKKINEINLKKASKLDLYKLLIKATKAMQNSVGTGHVIEGSVFVGEIFIKKELDVFLKDKVLANKVFALLTTSEEKSFLAESEELLQKIYKNPTNKKLIEKFKKDFGWIRNNYDYRRPFSNEEIIEEAKSRKFQKNKTLAEVKKEKKDIIKKLKLSKKLIFKLNDLAFIGSWQDERKKFILLACEYLFRVLEEYALRVGVDIKYIRFALPSELKNVEKIRDILKKRYEKSIYILTLKKTYIVTDDDYDELHKKMKKDEKFGTRQINGMVASPGKIIGKVKICSTLESFKKIKEGDILVSSMTRPEYIGAMRKAGGFVTDEGGITSHAAIVAREMGKPCIIGTRNATKILKDGDLVQVDAMHGVIRILETNKK